MLFSSTHAAENSPATQQQLNDLGTAIQEVDSWLQQANIQRSDDETALRAVELALQSGYKQLQTLQDRVAETQTLKAEIQQDTEQVQRQLAGQSVLVKASLRQVYFSGKQSQLKLLLTQQDPTIARRMLEYQRRISSSRLDLIDEYKTRLAQLIRLESELAVTESTLEASQSEVSTQNENLSVLRATRQQVLENLDLEIASQTTLREKLVADRARLEALLDRIDEAMDDIPVPVESIAFASLQGQLPWPAEGQLSSGYNDPYGDGTLRRQGVVIAGTPGDPVRAVHGGRVVFADWLRGYGLMSIIDHGNGYMSLYGYNQSLSATAGSMVRRGEVVATVGNSGGQTENGVYFEIRLNGRPQNPLEWCLRITN
ncbi:MAG: peptidoglycan DD-metalloendopeptidase family protein [Pseudohongiellaceae bacterium]